MIVITGAAGFIGSVLAGRLNQLGYNNLILVDDFRHGQKQVNYQSKQYRQLVDRQELLPWLADNHIEVEFVFHIGARTDTTEFDRQIFEDLNVRYSKEVWKACVDYSLPLIYASSAATYGDGTHGYKDDEETILKLKPLNPYGDSKQEFDLWVLEQKDAPPFWAGFKFFNVFGPNENHKGRMASVIYHAFNQITASGRLKLFRSHRPDFEDGGQMRDFIYVKDLVNVLLFFFETRRQCGIYNLGTGIARTFLDLGKATFSAMALSPQIDFVDTPADIRDKYQYYTQADMAKVRNAGYDKEFASLETAVEDYVTSYLKPGGYY